MKKTKLTRSLLAACSIVALSAVMYGCVHSGGDDAPATDTSGTPDPAKDPGPMPLDLPEGHALNASDEPLVIPAGSSVSVGRTTVECAGGGEDCTLSVIKQPVTGNLVASYTGGAPTVTVHTPQAGFQAFVNLSGALLDEPMGARDDLRTNNYHDGEDVAAAPTEEPPVVGVDNGGGVTSSLTTHEEPGGGSADPLSGVSDIAVSVSPSVVDPDDTDNSKTLAHAGVAVDDGADIPDVDDTEDIDESEMAVVMNPVLADGSSDRTALFDLDAAWANNPAATWMIDDLATSDSMEAGDIWTHYFQHEQALAGGRTLDIDIRSDFDPNAMTPGDRLVIATGPDSDTAGDPGSPVDMDMVTFDDPDLAGLALGGEFNLGSDGISASPGVEGSYMGVKGRFYCREAGVGDEVNICRINRHTRDVIGVSEDDRLVFIPYVYTDDVNWVTAGVWLTIPDAADGDYAVGSFVFGNDPYKPEDAAAARGLEGTASYAGQAFGRYAEEAEVGEGPMVTGRFTAGVALEANFDAGGGADGEMGNDFGTITGDVTGFMADGVARENWDVNFESAMLMMRQTVDDQGDVTVTSETALRFNAGASGHAGAMGDTGGGHALTGYWNGQFFGDPTNMDNDANPFNETFDAPWGSQPGSAAGTFGLTTERDAVDAYSLVMQGAFMTNWQEPPSDDE